ncbi:MAG: c-type cytochrome [Aggregatilineales bacterium]
MDRIMVRFALFVSMVIIGIAIILFTVNRQGESVAPQFVIPGADAKQAPALMESYGCGSCHYIPGVQGLGGTVGPRLDHFATQSYIAGQFANLPDNLIAWIENPQQMLPNNAMPNLNVSEQAARDMAAYLYTLR